MRYAFPHTSHSNSWKWLATPMILLRLPMQDTIEEATLGPLLPIVLAARVRGLQTADSSFHFDFEESSFFHASVLDLVAGMHRVCLRQSSRPLSSIAKMDGRQGNEHC